MSNYKTTVRMTVGSEALADVEVSYKVIHWGNSGNAASLSYPGDPPEPPEFEIESLLGGDTQLDYDKLSEAEQELIDNAVYDAICEIDPGDDYY